VPQDFRATLVRGTGERDVWFLGAKGFYQWDGATLRRAEAPLGAVDDAWVGPSGEMWVVGADRTRQVTTKDGPKPAGAAIRVPAPPKGRP
jgi:hypothetical protein